MQRSMIALAGAAGVALLSLGPTCSLAASDSASPPAPVNALAEKPSDAPPKPAEAAPAPASPANTPASDALRPQAADAPELKGPKPASARRSAKEAKPARPDPICKPVAIVHKPKHQAPRLAGRPLLAPFYLQAPGAIQVARGFPIILGIGY